MQSNKSTPMKKDNGMYDIKAETALIASIISAEESKHYEVSNEALESLVSNDFSPKHSKVFGAIEMIKSKHDGIADYASVDSMGRNIDPNVIADLMESATTWHIKPMIERVLKVSRVRQLMESARRVEIITKSGTDIDQIINDAEAEIARSFDVVDRGDKGIMLGDYICDYVAIKDNHRKNKITKGASTGFDHLDDVCGGMQRGDYIIIAGLPGMGKTSLVLSILAEQMKSNKNGAIFSLEMGNVAIIDRLTCIYNERVRDDFSNMITNYQHLKNIHKAQEADYMLYQRSWQDFRDKNLYINDDPNITINKIKSICRRQNSKKKLDYIIIDHSLLLVQDRTKEREELTQMSAIIRKMSKELNTVIILVSQLNYRDGKATRPHKGMLKGSGSLAEDSDMILFPWRPFEVKKEGNPEDACIVIGKARSFESKDIPVRFCTISTGFYGLSDDEYNRESQNTSRYFEEHKQKSEDDKPKFQQKPKEWEQ